jgi:MinD superfamily P-loop ATPase
MQEAVTIVLTLLFAALFIYFNSKKAIKKTKIQTKSEIINRYENELLGILKNCEDRDLQIKERIEFLKRVNQELSMNIFFDKEESKKVLEKLSKMECI